MAFIAHAITIVVISFLIVIFGAQIIHDTKAMYNAMKEDEKNGKSK